MQHSVWHAAKKKIVVNLEIVYRFRIFSVALIVVVLDQLTKIAAVAYLEGKPAISLIGRYFQLSFVRNPGAAFSMGTNITIVFTIFSLTVSALIIWKANIVTHGIWAIAAGGFLGGALGNLIDRLLRSPGIFHGHVVDFLMFPNFPLFNIADTAVTLSAVLAVLLSARGIEFSQEEK